MEIQTVRSGVITVYIEEPELSAYVSAPGRITARDAADILTAALASIGRAPCPSADLELYPGRDALLLFARLCADAPDFFVFDDLEALIPALQACPPGLVSTVTKLGNTYVLTVRPWHGDKAPAHLAEFGTPFRAPPAYAAHLAEHGTRIAGPDAADVFRNAF